VSVAVSAPGKLFLAGEYAVLAGGTAVVAAIDRRVVARFVPGAKPSTPLVAETVRAVHDLVRSGGQLIGQMLGEMLTEGAPEIDSSALSEGGRKLGLGSSAAVAAASIGALLEAVGMDLDQERPLALRLALRAHRAAQDGRGSGGDVAVAVIGGVIAYTRRGASAETIRPVAANPPGELVVFWAGSPSSTVDHLRAVERLAERDPTTHASRLLEIGEAADEFLRAYESGQAAALIEAVGRSHRALEALGRDADLPIVTPALEAAAALAGECAGAAKPSGAGGGDVGIAFFAHPDAAQAFRARAPQLDLPILNIKTGARGLARDG
jgi:phosphomevalonate kinase